MDKLKIKMMTQITSMSKAENSLVQQHIIQRGKMLRSNVCQILFLELSVTTSLPWCRGHSNDLDLHILADGCDFRFGGTSKEKVLGVRGRALEPSCSLTKQCYFLSSVLHPIHLFLAPSANSPASRKIAPTDSGSKLNSSHWRKGHLYVWRKAYNESQKAWTTELVVGLKHLRWTDQHGP